MMIKTVVSLLIIILSSIYSLGQDKFAYFQNNKLYISSINGNVSYLGSDIKIKRDKIIKTSRYFTCSLMPRNVLAGMQLSVGWDFYSSLQSMDDTAKWLFVERNMRNASYNVWIHESGTNSKKLIFSQDLTPQKASAFIPFAWIDDIIYVESKIFGSATENEGIWSYNMKTKQFSKLPLSHSYITTPVISSNGQYLIYGGTIDLNKNLDSPMNIVFLYDTINKQEKTVAKDSKSSFWILGWVTNKIETSDLIGPNEDESLFEKDNLKSKRIIW